MLLLTSPLRFLSMALSVNTIWWLLWFVVATISLSLFYWPESLQQLWFYDSGQWLLLLLIADAARQRAKLCIQRTRQGWMLISLAIIIWLSSALLGAVAELLPLPLPLWLLEDSGYLVYYVVLNAVVSRNPDRSWIKLEHAFILMLFGYMILLPVFIAPAEYESFKPSTLFYLCMDLYLLQQAWQLNKSSVWPAQELRLLLWILSLIFVNDLLDTLMFLGWLPDNAAHPAASLYFLPLLLTALLLKCIPQSTAEVSNRGASVRYSFDWIVFVCGPCVVHLLGYLVLDFEPALRGVRDFYLCCWLICVALVFIRSKQHVTIQSIQDQVTMQSKTISVTRPELLDKLDQVLEARLGQTNLRLADIADDLNMQPRQLQRKLNDICALTPEQYWLNWRLQRAAELLMQGNKVAYVVVATGFSQQSHFTRRFKDKFGVTPGEYAKSGGWTEMYKKYHHNDRDRAKL